MRGGHLFPECDRRAIPVGAPAETWRRFLAAAAAARPVVCVDFDGTMTKAAPYTPGTPAIGAQPGVKQALAAWVAEGYRIVVLTARPVVDVWPWLATQGLTPLVSEVTNTKPPAVAYIDDRAVSFGGDWEAVRARVRELGAAQPTTTPEVSARVFHRKLKEALGQAAPAEVRCPHCDSHDWGLMAPDFETAKCAACGKNFQHPSPPMPDDPPITGRFVTVEEMRELGRQALARDPDILKRAREWRPHDRAAQPTPAQADAGNYKKDHVRVHGLDVAIENPAGSIRRSKHLKADGTPEWETRMAYAYGDLKKTEGADGDAVDVFLTPDPEGSDRVFIINQVDPATGRFDEHKVVLGARNETEARGIYLANYDASGPQRIGSIREMSIEDFKVWAFDGPRRVEAASYFEQCPRDERGWCEPGGGSEPSSPPEGTRSQIDAGKPAALRTALHRVENEISPLRDREIGVAIRADGTVVARREGRENEVRFSTREKRQFADAVVVHNHPGGSPFSNADVRLAIVHNAAEVRVVTPSGALYAMQRPSGGWPSAIAVQFARDVASVALAKDAALAQGDRAHQSWVQVAEQLGLTYHRVRL